MRRLDVAEERWPLLAPFVIARGAKTEAHVIVVTLRQGDRVGRGEGTPYARYGETAAGCLDQLEAVRSAVEAGAGREDLARILPAGSARNALDCALWDLEAKLSGQRVWDLAGRPEPQPTPTAFTLSLGAPADMAEAARRAARRPLLKLKIGGPDDLDRVAAVRQAAPRADLIVDANEALTFDDLQRLAPELSRLGVRLIEQPLPAGADERLEGYASPVTLCADEAVHTRADLATASRRYGAVNIKLDKTGGLTEALKLQADAAALGLRVMVGCMVSTSLSMAPAMVLTPGAEIVDLDGPLLLSRDRAGGLTYEGSLVGPPDAAFWG